MTNSFELTSILSALIFLFIVFAVPVLLTGFNIFILISKKYKFAYVIYPLTVIIGSILYLVFIIFMDVTGPWYEAILQYQLHECISSDHWLGFILPIVLGYIGVGILLYGKDAKKPPLLSALAISSIIVMNVFQVLFAIQIYKNFAPLSQGVEGLIFLGLPYLFHANVLIASAYAVRKQMTSQIKIFDQMRLENEDAENINIEPGSLYKIVKNMSNYSALIFLCLFVVIAVLEVIFIITGQGYDAAVKAFTDTADWTFSQQIPPPPLDYPGHYLCTVAAGGHKKVVKPQRFGKRRGAIIIVNRQLCIANAFEDYIQEKFPRFHRFIRHVYDTYGYPISKFIDTPLKADIVYFVMKPLEWVFLLFLYMFDVRPEKRIKNQYVLK